MTFSSKKRVVLCISLYLVLLSLACAAIATSLLSLYAPKWDNYEFQFSGTNVKYKFNQNLWGRFLRPKLNNAIMKMGSFEEDFKDYTKLCLMTSTGLGIVFIFFVVIDMMLSSPLQEHRIRRSLFLLTTICLPSAAVYLILSGAAKFKQLHIEKSLRTDATALMKKTFSIDEMFTLTDGYRMCLISAGMFGGVAALQLGNALHHVLVTAIRKVKTKGPTLTKVEDLKTQKIKKNEVTTKKKNPEQFKERLKKTNGKTLK